MGVTRRDDVDVQSIQAQKAGSDHGLQYEGSPSGRISKRLLYQSQSSCMMRMVASTQQPEFLRQVSGSAASNISLLLAPHKPPASPPLPRYTGR